MRSKLRFWWTICLSSGAFLNAFGAPSLTARSEPNVASAPSKILSEDTLAKVRKVMEEICYHRSVVDVPGWYTE